MLLKKYRDKRDREASKIAKLSFASPKMVRTYIFCEQCLWSVHFIMTKLSDICTFQESFFTVYDFFFEKIRVKSGSAGGLQHRKPKKQCKAGHSAIAAVTFKRWEVAKPRIRPNRKPSLSLPSPHHPPTPRRHGAES